MPDWSPIPSRWPPPCAATCWRSRGSRHDRAGGPSGRSVTVERRSVMRTAIVRSLLVTALAVALAAPASAATWGPLVRLSDTVASTENVQLVTGSDGRVLAVWTYRLGNGVFGVEAVSRRPDG